MIEFVWPYLFLLIPLPWLVYRYLPRTRMKGGRSLKVPFLSDFKPFRKSSLASFPRLKSFLAFLIWCTLVAAAARPQWIGKAIEIPQSGRDLMLAVDLSGSMQMKDFRINNHQIDRLTALKLIASDFIDRRVGDRIGLILFGSQAYLHVPLTFDLPTVKQLLLESSVGLAGVETAIGDAIGLAVKHLRDSPSESRVLILLTDGNNSTGQLSPEKAAELAAHAQLKIHTVAIGAKETVVPTIFGSRKVNPSAEIDEKALKMVAEKTGGKYFRAYDTEELAQIYQEINRLETIERSQQFFRPTDEIYRWPLMAALIGIGLLMVDQGFRRRYR